MQIKKVERLLGSKAANFCYDDTIKTYMESIGLKHEYAYFTVLSSQYLEMLKRDISLIDSGGDWYNIDKNLKKYAGVKINTVSDINVECLKIIMDQINSGKIVCVSVLGYNCPWDWRYELVEDGFHEFLVVGYKYEDDSYICCDPYYDIEEVEISKEDLINGLQEIKLFEQCDVETFDEIEALLQSIAQVKKDYVYLKDFFDDEVFFDVIFDSDDKEFLQYDDMLFSRIISQIMHNRLRFAFLLELFSMKQHAKEFVELAERWNNIKFLYVKSVFVDDKNYIKDRIQKKIHELIQKEYEYVEYLENWLNSNNNGIANTEPCDIYDEYVIGDEQIFVDISDYFNSRAFGLRGDVNGMNEYFCEIEELNVSGLVDVEGVKYQIFHKNENDNIMCMGQKIVFDATECHYLSLLYCSDFGNYLEEIVLNYEDGTSQVATIHFWEYFDGEAIQKNVDKYAVEKVIKEKNGGFDGGIVGKEKCYLYSEKICVNKDKKLASIYLPDCSNLHVFAVTLI